MAYTAVSASFARIAHQPSREKRFSAGVLAVLAVALIASPAHADQDAWGNTYPPECSIVATSAVHAPVIRVSQSFLDKATGTPDRVGVMLPTGAIAIRDDLTGALLADTLRHEYCHLLMRQMTGDPSWHGGH